MAFVLATTYDPATIVGLGYEVEKVLRQSYADFGEQIDTINQNAQDPTEPDTVKIERHRQNEEMATQLTHNMLATIEELLMCVKRKVWNEQFKYHTEEHIKSRWNEDMFKFSMINFASVGHSWWEFLKAVPPKAKLYRDINPDIAAIETLSVELIGVVTGFGLIMAKKSAHLFSVQSKYPLFFSLALKGVI